MTTKSGPKAKPAKRKRISAQPEPESKTAQSLGMRIRRLRQDRNWKLADLSERSDIAISTLSKVENGSLSLTYDRLQQTAKAFDMTLSEFLAEAPAGGAAATPTARISWARKGSGNRIDTRSYLYLYLCDELQIKSMVPIRSQVYARTLEEFGPLLKHPGEEFAFVLRGRVAVHTEYYSPGILEEGEGVYIDSRMGHAYLNAGEGEAWIMSINSQAAVDS